MDKNLSKPVKILISCNILLGTSFCFLQVNQQKHVEKIFLNCKPSHIMFLIRQRRSTDAQYLINMNLVFPLAASAMITNLIEPHMEKLILNHWIRNNYPEFRNGPLDSYFFKNILTQ